MARLALLTLIPLCWQPVWGQAPGVGVNPGHNQKQQTKLATPQTQANQRGTKDAPIAVDVLVHPKTQEETAEEKREKDRAKRIEGWMVGSAIAAAAFTGALVVIGFLGVRAANRTLGAIEKQAALMQAQVNEMQEAGKQAAKHLGLTERPWVSIKTTISGPLIFDANELSIKFRVELSNVGRSPAIGIGVNPIVFFPSKGSAAEVRKLMCAGMIGSDSRKFGEIVFPNVLAQYMGDITISVPTNEASAAAVSNALAIQLILCVVYRSTIDEAARHYTAMIYDLTRVDATSDRTFPLPITEAIPAEKLRLTGSLQFGPVAE